MALHFFLISKENCECGSPKTWNVVLDLSLVGCPWRCRVSHLLNVDVLAGCFSNHFINMELLNPQKSPMYYCYHVPTLFLFFVFISLPERQKESSHPPAGSLVLVMAESGLSQELEAQAKSSTQGGQGFS